MACTKVKQKFYFIRRRRGKLLNPSCNLANLILGLTKDPFAWGGAGFKKVYLAFITYRKPYLTEDPYGNTPIFTRGSFTRPCFQNRPPFAKGVGSSTVRFQLDLAHPRHPSVLYPKNSFHYVCAFSSHALPP